MLRSRLLDARQKGIIATVFAGGLWTRDHRRSDGYDAPRECGLCGATHGHADSVHHRLWVCPHISVVTARERALCPPTPLREALAADPSDLSSVFTSGRHVVDPSEWPTLAEHYQKRLSTRRARRHSSRRSASWLGTARRHRRSVLRRRCLFSARRPYARPRWVGKRFGQGRQQGCRHRLGACFGSHPYNHLASPSVPPSAASSSSSSAPPSSTPATPRSCALGKPRRGVPLSPLPLGTAASRVSSTLTRNDPLYHDRPQGHGARRRARRRGERRPTHSRHRQLSCRCSRQSGSAPPPAFGLLQAARARARHPAHHGHAPSCRPRSPFVAPHPELSIFSSPLAARSPCGPSPPPHPAPSPTFGSVCPTRHHDIAPPVSPSPRETPLSNLAGSAIAPVSIAPFRTILTQAQGQTVAAGMCGDMPIPCNDRC